MIEYDFDFITDEEIREIQELTGMSRKNVIDDFSLFCKYAEVPMDWESWRYYMIETRDQF